MATARDIITRSLQKIGALTKNQSPSADEADDGLVALNGMIGMWSNDSLMTIARTLENFPLVSNTSTYSIGPGQTFNTVRPIQIIDMYVRSGTIDYPMSPISDDMYANIQFKPALGIPEFYNYSNGYPSASIKLYPVPSSNYQLYILSEKELTSFASLDTVVSLPPGWEMALVYNLAILLAPEYGQPVSQDTASIAASSLRAIQKAVNKNRSFDAQPARGPGVYNFYAGFVR